MARPTKLNDVCTQAIVKAIRAGVSLSGAAKSAGIGERTLFDWLSRGRAGEVPFEQFSQRVREAEGHAETFVVSKLFEQIEDGNVGATCFWLERRRPEEWGKRDVVTHVDRPDTADIGGDLEVARSVVAALESRKGAA